MDTSRITSIPNQQTGLDNIIAAGTNDHVLSSEIAEATSAKADTVSQAGLDAGWEANIDLATPDLDNAALDPRLADIVTRQAQATSRDAELDVTLSTRVTPKSLYNSRFFWLSARARLSNGSFSLFLEAGNGIVTVNGQIAANVETIDETNRLLSQKQHSTDAFLAL